MSMTNEEAITNLEKLVALFYTEGIWLIMCLLKLAFYKSEGRR